MKNTPNFKEYFAGKHTSFLIDLTKEMYSGKSSFEDDSIVTQTIVELFGTRDYFHLNMLTLPPFIAMELAERLGDFVLEFDLEKV